MGEGGRESIGGNNRSGATVGVTKHVIMLVKRSGWIASHNREEDWGRE